ncbi:hypothetical protein LTS15_000112 [Exophiala xenobiotica]|nr:hypothetical protein LTS15_000112 [Exophiala xenobiotica]
MIYDVAIVGAGPCGLAAAARLRESTPAALFTDDEHARYWRRFNRKESIEKERKSGKQNSRGAASSEREPSGRSMIVLDAHSDQWMSAWKEKFQHLEISQLRSPLFFHPDPRDRDGLLAFSHFHDRTGELQEIHNVVGREVSKHRTKKKRDKKVARHLRVDDRDRVDYFTPSSQLFEDFCDDIVCRYRLRNLIVQGRVQIIEYGHVGSKIDPQLFALTTDEGMMFSKTVVLAIGPGSKPSIPRNCQLRLEREQGSLCHCFDTTGPSCLPDHVLRKIREGQSTGVVVVGGGLTSAQIADLALRGGVKKVWLLLRGKYKVKHFDVDLEWVSKVRNQQMSVFWSADSDEERFDMLKEARNGGSITPLYDKILRRHVASGRLEILTDTHIEEGIWCGASETWSIGLSSSSDQEISLPRVDHVIYATGSAPNIHDVACMQRINENYPIDAIGGLPKITEDLMWHEDIPLFLTGGLAGLRLGPGAGNLAGARQGAERIAWKIDELLGTSQGGPLKAEQVNNDLPRPSATSIPQTRAALLKDRNEFTGSFANQFEALSMQDEEVV